ncbi:MAG: YncE family protein [Bacteroidetes bacterium]|nr:YncE family protein [Bacteroidota bacterium]
MKSFHFLSIITSVIFCTSCIKDKPPVDNSKVDTSSSGVYITNEGTFQFGNASVSYYNVADNAVQEDLFKPANNRDLGDVAQSMCIYNNKIYIVVNNSGKIEVVDSKTFLSQGTITGLTSPRYFVPVSDSKAYVSDFKSDKISIINLSNNTVSGNISCTGWTEEMIFSSGKVFVTNQRRNKLYVINTSADAITDSIVVGYGSNSIKEDKNGKLWVLCGGDDNLKIAASLHCLNPLNLQVEQSFSIISGSPWRLKTNGSKDTLYFLNNGVFMMPITGALPSQSFIPAGNKSFYGLGVDPVSGVIYVADAMDYVQKSTVYRYKSDGTLISSFKSGITSGDFYFKP